MTIDVYVQNMCTGPYDKAIKVGTPNSSCVLTSGQSATICVSDGSPLTAEEVSLDGKSPEPRFGFDTAIRLVKRGYRLSRAGWNGKGMYVFINFGSHHFQDDFWPTQPHDNIGGVSPYLFVRGDTGTTTRMPNLNMHAADGSTVVGWLASQTDMLAEDWGIAP